MDAVELEGGSVWGGPIKCLLFAECHASYT